MVDAVFQGYSCFSHMEELRTDQAYLSICGVVALSEKVCRDTLALLPPDAASVLRGINEELLAMQAKTEGVHEVAADFDDSVITVFGNQEQSNVGYNPKYHGRPSYKEKVGIISGTKELVDLTLEEGIHHSNFEFLDFFKRFGTSFPKEWLLNGCVLTGGFTMTITLPTLKIRAMSTS